MAGVFQQFRDKFTAKLRDFTDSHTQDELDKALQDLVDRATSELLLGSDWGYNMELVDRINENIGVSSEKSLRALRRTMAKPNAKVQLLALTVLETCVKNCYPQFHTFLATSELWTDLLKMATDTGVVRIDGEVRDRILIAVEDYARVLAPDEFRKAYDTLLDQGVDFPVRGPDDSAPPILTPPSSAPQQGRRSSSSFPQQPPQQPFREAEGSAAGGLLPSSEDDTPSAVPSVSESNARAAAAARSVAAAAAAAFEAEAWAGNAPTATAQTAQTPIEPWGGMSEEDRIAVAMAMAEMEAEEFAAAAAQQRARQYAASMPPNQQQQQQQQQQPSALQSLQQRQQLLAQAASAAEFAPRSPHDAEDEGAVGVGGERVEQEEQEVVPGGHGPGLAAAEDLLQVSSNSCSLLSELLAGLSSEAPGAVRDDPLVSDLTQQVVLVKGRLEKLISRLMEEEASSSWVGDGSGSEAGLEGLLAVSLERHMAAAEVISRVEAILEAAGPNPAAMQGQGQYSERHQQRRSQRSVPPPPAPTPMLQPPQPSATAQYGAAAAAAGSSLKARISAAASTFAAAVRTGTANASQSIKNVAANASSAASSATGTAAGRGGEMGISSPYPDVMFQSSPVFGATTRQGQEGEESELLNPFTLDDYDQEEAEGEGASLLTKRTGGQQEGPYQQQQQQHGGSGTFLAPHSPSRSIPAASSGNNTFGQYTSNSRAAAAAAMSLDSLLMDTNPGQVSSSHGAVAHAGAEDSMFGDLQVVDLHSTAQSAEHQEHHQQQANGQSPQQQMSDILSAPLQQQPSLKIETVSSFTLQEEEEQQQQGGSLSDAAGTSPGVLAQQQHSHRLVELMDRLVLDQGSGAFTPPGHSPDKGTGITAATDGSSAATPLDPLSSQAPLPLPVAWQQRQQREEETHPAAEKLLFGADHGVIGEQLQQQAQQLPAQLGEEAFNTTPVAGLHTTAEL